MSPTEHVVRVWRPFPRGHAAGAAEWSSAVERCTELWLSDASQVVDRTFLKAHPAGVTWDCSVCDAVQGATNGTGAAGSAQSLLAGAAALVEQQQLCATCVGFPRGHPECLGSRWAQRFSNIPTAMWFMLVIMTPSVSLDKEVYPATAQGKVFVVCGIVTGILFLAMPLSTVGQNFNRVWEVCTPAGG